MEGEPPEEIYWEHEMHEPVEEKSDPAAVRVAYRTWWEEIHAVNDKFLDSTRHLVCEDLGDFVDGISTLVSFGPNPRTWKEEEDA